MKRKNPMKNIALAFIASACMSCFVGVFLLINRDLLCLVLPGEGTENIVHNDSLNDDEQLAYFLAFIFVLGCFELLASIIWLTKINSREKEIEELKFNGNKIKTMISEVRLLQPSRSLKTFCTIYSEGKNPNTGELHTFKSVSILFNKEMEQAKEIQVYISHQNYNNYYVDVDSFEEKYSEQIKI